MASDISPLQNIEMTEGQLAVVTELLGSVAGSYLVNYVLFPGQEPAAETSEQAVSLQWRQHVILNPGESKIVHNVGTYYSTRDRFTNINGDAEVRRMRRFPLNHILPERVKIIEPPKPASF